MTADFHIKGEMIRTIKANWSQDKHKVYRDPINNLNATHRRQIVWRTNHILLAQFMNGFQKERGVQANSEKRKFVLCSLTILMYYQYAGRDILREAKHKQAHVAMRLTIKGGKEQSH